MELQVRVGDRVVVLVSRGRRESRKQKVGGVVVGVYPKHVGVQLDTGCRESFHYDEIVLVGSRGGGK